MAMPKPPKYHGYNFWAMAVDGDKAVSHLCNKWWGEAGLMAAAFLNRVASLAKYK